MEAGEAPPGGEICKVYFKFTLPNCTGDGTCTDMKKMVAMYGYLDYTLQSDWWSNLIGILEFQAYMIFVTPLTAFLNIFGVFGLL